MRKIFLEHQCTNLCLNDHEYFFKSFRMNPTNSELLLSWVGLFIRKASLRREVETPGERLCVTLRQLVTGDAHITIGLSYRLCPITVGCIIYETTQVIWKCLVEKGYMNASRSTREWRQISAEFTEQWDFPNCIGAIDAKHVKIQAPARIRPTYFNYKKNIAYLCLLFAILNMNFLWLISEILEDKVMVEYLTTVHLELFLKTNYY